jgi:hypothetical protein
MALDKVHTTKGSTNGKRRAPRADVKVAAKKLRRAEGKLQTKAQAG